MNNFIDTKLFNRCRLHPLIAAALNPYLSQLENGAEMSRRISSQSENEFEPLDENVSQI